MSDIPNLRESIDETGAEAHVSPRRSDSTKEWIDRDFLRQEFGDDSYVSTVKDDAQTRYRLRTGDEKPERWSRSVLTVEGLEKEDLGLGEVELVVEIKGAEAPWNKGDELSVGADVLEYEPVRLRHVAGMEVEKEELTKFLEGIGGDYGLTEQTGILLEGPPGTGKTELVREVCQERYGSVPVTVSGPEILSRWVGDSEHALRRKFEEARETRHKVLYIDDLDAIARPRGDGTDSHSAPIVAQLLVLLDGVEAKRELEEAGTEAVKVVASTNISHVVDPALRRPGRLGNRPIQFGLPSYEERKAILHHYLEKIHTSEDGTLDAGLAAFVEEGDTSVFEDENDVLSGTDGFTGADIEDWIRESAKVATNEENKDLDVDTLTEVLSGGGFSRDRGFKETVIEPDGTSPRSVGSKPTVCRRDGRTPSRIVRDEGDPSYRYRHRVVTPKDLLEDDFVRTKENVVQAFRHGDDERLLLEIDDWTLLNQAREESHIANRLIGIVHEELLKWENENILLLVDDTDTSGLDMLDEGG